MIGSGLIDGPTGIMGCRVMILKIAVHIAINLPLWFPIRLTHGDLSIHLPGRSLNVDNKEFQNLQLCDSSGSGSVSSCVTCARNFFGMLAFSRMTRMASEPANAAVVAADPLKITGWPPVHRSEEIRMPAPFNRRMFVYNCRNSDGRTRTTTLAITTAKHRPLMYLTRQEFDALIAVSDEIKAALVEFHKKL